MAHIDGNEDHGDLASARRQARLAGHVQNAQMMLMAAGLAAFAIVAVAAAMMATLL